MNPIHRILDEHGAVVEALRSLSPQIQGIADRMIETLERGGVLYWLGNGGSAADCQHLAAELVGRFARWRRPLAAIALTTDTSALTAISNDLGFEQVFARQVAALCGPLDLVIGLSTSGNSPNVLRAVETAGKRGIGTLGFTGRTGGRLADRVDQCLRIPSTDTARIQEMHLFVGHILCDLIETHFRTGDEARV